MSEWANDKGRFWAEHAEWFTRMLSGFGEALAEGAAAVPGEAVLDVGCGNGDTALAAADAVGPEGSVLGVDLSADEVEVARRRATDRGVANATFEVADAGAADFGGRRFDLVQSRFGVMFFADPASAFAHLRRAVRPGGRLAFVCWQDVEVNPWIAVPRQAIGEVIDLPVDADTRVGGHSLADPERVRGLLEGAGFGSVTLDDVERPVVLGDTGDEAVGFIRTSDFGRAMLEPAPPEVAEAAIARAAAAFEAHHTPDGISLLGRAWLVRARA